MQNRRVYRLPPSRSIILAFGLIAFALPHSNLPGVQLKLDKIVLEAHTAAEALANFNQKNEKTFDLVSIASAGRMADLYLMQGRKDKAEEILVPYLDQATRHRVVSTSATKFGAPLPTLPTGLNATQIYVWKLETLVALAHGKRFDEAIKILDEFPSSKSTPANRLRYLKIIGEKCMDAGNEEKGLEVASLMWKEFKQLPVENPTRYTSSIDMVNLAIRLQSKSPLKRLLTSVNPLFAKPFTTQELDSEQIARLFQNLAIGNAISGEFESAFEHLSQSRSYVAKTEDSIMSMESIHHQVEMAYAEVFRLQKDDNQSFKHTQKALNWLAKIKDKDDAKTASLIDGGDGFFSAVAAYGKNADIKKIVMAQAKTGHIEEARKTWQSMPLSIQKILCQIELAKYFLANQQQERALECSQSCLDLIQRETSTEDQIAITAGALNVLHLCGQLDQRDQLAHKLVQSKGLQQNDQALQSLAGELIAIGLLDKAYHVIQLIENDHQRAAPLSRLALALGEKDLNEKKSKLQQNK